MMGRGERVGRLILTGFVSIAVLYFLLPLAVIVGTSFTATAYLRFPPAGFTLAWYGKLLGDSSYSPSIGLSAHPRTSATVPAAVLCVPAPCPLARGRVPP